MRLTYSLTACMLLTACSLFQSCGSATSSARTSSARQLREFIRAGRLYARYCALCHGAKGEGYAADNANQLANPYFLAAATDRFLYASIARGRPGTPMSAWGEAAGGPLVDAEIKALVGHLRAWSAGASLPQPARHVEGDAQTGSGIYNARCASCHGTDGEGTRAVSLNNPIFHQTVSDAYVWQAVAYGRPGTAMPAFLETLGSSSVDDVVRHVRTLHRPAETEATAVGPKGIHVINPDGAPPQFRLRERLYVPVDQVKCAVDDGQRLILIDARATSDYLREHIAGAISLPFYTDPSGLSRLPRDGTWIVAYCACPHAASGQVVRALREQGYRHTAILDEGFTEWKRRGYLLAR